MLKLAHRLSVGAKLGLAFAIVLTLLVGLGAFAVVQLDRVKSQSNEIADNWMPSAVSITQASREMSRYRSNEFRVLLAGDETRAAAEKSLADRLAGIDKVLARYVALIGSERERALYDAMYQRWLGYLALSHRMQDELKTGSRETAGRILSKESLAAFGLLTQATDELVALNDQGAAAAREQAEAIYASSLRWVVALSLAGLAAGALLAVTITRMITRPLGSAVRQAQAVAAGDLSQALAVSGHDEVAQLLRAQAEMVGKLRDLVARVRHGVESVSSASSQIASGNHDLSARTEEAASSLQQTASSMEELTGTVGQSADTARQANQLAVAAAEAATQGGAVVGEVVESMRRIDASSKKIGEIIGVIDEIAFQTNILALNAAVEAARAGEQGRGFAVVASEVRSLAQRSATAAKEIKTLIIAATGTVESGARQVDSAGAAMQQIVTSVQRVTDLMAEIAAAASEQRDGIGQVNQAVTQLDHVTQQNAALVEESAAAAASLSEQARRLADVVAVFKVGDSPAGVDA
jgi:methyl-accepting chemotaxis protein